ncbi:uncharacterized protein [Linepithema humile]|uniref:uncharacterized protein n=1 Tax=Linepithema humile TaxID=83485 RepID=UPI00351EB4FE
MVALFVDLKVAFDSVERGVLVEAMGERGIREGMVVRVEEIMRETRSRVRVGGKMGEAFWTARGVRQGCPLSPLLFNVVTADLEEKMRKVRWGEVRLGEKRIYTSAYADDIVMMAENEEEMGSMIERLEGYLERKRLELNMSKTKILRFRKGGGRMGKKVWRWRGKVMEEVEEYKYLGYTLKRNGNQEAHIRERVKRAAAIMGQSRNIGVEEKGENGEVGEKIPEVGVGSRRKNVRFLQSVKVIRKNGKDITNSVKSVRCWIITINSILELWNYLNLQQSSVPIQYLLTRRLNQDCLENFFGTIKQSGNAFNPTSMQFYYSFKKLFSIDYIKANSGNCAADEESILIRCQHIKRTQNVIFQTSSKAATFITSGINKYDYRNLSVTEENVFFYICGYLLHRLFIKHLCDTCTLLAGKDCNLDEARLYSYFKTYDNTNDMFGSLYVPSAVFANYIRELYTKFFENINIIIETNVMQKFMQILSTIQFSHPCCDFPNIYLLKLFIRMRLYYILKFINRNFKTKKRSKKNLLFCVIINNLNFYILFVFVQYLFSLICNT